MRRRQAPTPRGLIRLATWISVSSDIELITDNDTGGGYSQGTQKVGLRFTAMSIPAGATITSAYLTFRAIAADAPMTNSDPTNLTIKGQLIANAPTFPATNGDISGRTLTTAAASWVPTAWTTGTDYDSPSIVSVIQEIVNQGGWVSGNAIAIIITGTGHRASQAYDSAPATAAKLVVTYAATGLYRSVGITGAALASGAANALTISGSTASFASALPNNIGVGDAIQYDSDSNGSIDALAFIHGRTNSQTYTVKNKSGAAPTATAGPDNDWASLPGLHLACQLGIADRERQHKQRPRRPQGFRHLGGSRGRQHHLQRRVLRGWGRYDCGHDRRLDHGCQPLHQDLHPCPVL